MTEKTNEKPTDLMQAPASPRISNKKHPDSPFIIGIGASAGGLEALRALLSHLDTLVGASFVVVQHMSPTYRSMLAELLSRDTIVRVKEAADGDSPAPNVLYVTPPNRDIVLRGGRLRLLDSGGRIGPKPSIDRCFISLADELGHNCGGIILSGTGSDGAQGARAIRAAGGFVIAQQPESAKYDSMPRAAIGTGMVDIVLPAADIGVQLSSIVEHLRESDAAHDADEPEPDEPFRAIVGLLKRRTRVDFELYKPNTLRRRIQRRINANRLGGMPQYLELLHTSDAEVKRLFQDVLISATAFFRDKDQYESLKSALRKSLADRTSDAPIRVWSAGCATGEEPYSLIILTLELLKELKLDLDVQVFATDIDDETIIAARRGVYSEAAVEHVPPELLNAYFDKLDGSYQIRKSVRERVIFSRHDLTRDPPFLRMDLIACRNVLIYFSAPLQERVIKLFHYALNPTGVLFLGKAESVGVTKSYFAQIDAKLFQRNDRPSDLSIPFSSLQLERGERHAAERWHTARAGREQVSALVRGFAPDSLVLDDDFAVRELYGAAREVLSFPEGALTQSIEKLLAPELKSKIVTLLHRAKRSKEMAVGTPFEIDSAAGRRSVQPRAYFVQIQGAPRIVLSFEAISAQEGQAQPAQAVQPGHELAEVERELAATREHLQNVVEAQETANEELQALNEELQSANEELQSTNEELETANEELQSTNEELTTLNEELNVKSNELLDVNNYLRAIQDAIQYPVMSVDRNLNLVDFNRAAETLFQVDVRHRNKNIRLIPRRELLSDALEAIEQCMTDGRAQMLRSHVGKLDLEVTCQAIRDHTGRIYGVVASFMDYSDLAQKLRRAEDAERRLAAMFEDMPALVSVKDPAGVYVYANQRFCQTLGRDKTEVGGKTDADLFPPHVAAAFRQSDLDVLSSGQGRMAEERIEGRDAPRVYLATRFPLLGSDAMPDAVCNISLDITERAEAHRTLKLFQDVISSSNQSILIFSQTKEAAAYAAQFISSAFVRTFKIDARMLETAPLYDVLNVAFGARQTEELVRRFLAHDAATMEARALIDEAKWYEVRATHYPRGELPGKQLCLTIVDITERKEHEALVRSRQEEVLKTARLASLGEMAAGIAHELNTPLNTIQSYVDLVRHTRTDGKPNPQYVDKAINGIEDTIDRISDIITGLRSFTKVDRVTDLRDCDMVALVRDVITMCDLNVRNAGVRVEFEPGETVVPVRCQPTQICQVLVNLLNNAVDAVRNLAEKWIRIRIQSTDNEVRVYVIDSGPGIAEKIAAMVFTPFFTTKDEGTGLGLSLARSIMKAHEGDLVIDASQRNTCFLMTLPR